jgi:hypothetical protein
LEIFFCGLLVVGLASCSFYIGVKQLIDIIDEVQDLANVKIFKGKEYEVLFIAAIHYETFFFQCFAVFCMHCIEDEKPGWTLTTSHEKVSVYPDQIQRFFLESDKDIVKSIESIYQTMVEMVQKLFTI